MPKFVVIFCAVVFLSTISLITLFTVLQHQQPKPSSQERSINVEIQPPRVEIQNQLPKEQLPPATPPSEEKKKGQVRVWPFVRINWEKQ